MQALCWWRIRRIETCCHNVFEQCSSNWQCLTVIDRRCTHRHYFRATGGDKPDNQQSTTDKVYLLIIWAPTIFGCFCGLDSGRWGRCTAGATRIARAWSIASLIAVKSVASYCFHIIPTPRKHLLSLGDRPVVRLLCCTPSRLEIVDGENIRRPTNPSFKMSM